MFKIWSKPRFLDKDATVFKMRLLNFRKLHYHNFFIGVVLFFYPKSSPLGLAVGQYLHWTCKMFWMKRYVAVSIFCFASELSKLRFFLLLLKWIPSLIQIKKAAALMSAGLKSFRFWKWNKWKKIKYISAWDFKND